MICIDGIIYSLQRNGGITVYFKELISYLFLNKVQFAVTLEEPILQGVTKVDDSIATNLRSARVLERYRRCRLPDKTNIFHSSYYRLPDRRGIPTVVTVHDFIYERYVKGVRRHIHSMQKNAAIKAAQSVICVSEATRQDLLEFVGETPGQTIHVIHNGVSDAFYPLVQEPSPVAVPFILYVGQRGGYKNFKLVLDAMAFLPNLVLYCVGGGALHTNELAGVPESVACRIKHAGFVNDESLNALYNHAICLVYPSSYEGFGIPVIEAMRAGCPVVSVDCKAVLEIGRSALTVASELDPNALAEAILNTTSSARSALVQRGFAVAKNFSWEVTHRQTLEVYRSLCN